MAVINVQNWTVEQVVDWVTGLDPQLSQHGVSFSANGITGQKLLTMMSGDLDYLLGIKRIGDQLLLHDAIQTLRDELSIPWTTLQTLSLSLSVRCKNYRSELTQQKQKYEKEKEVEAYNHHHHHHHHHYGHHHHHHHHHDFKSSALGSSSQNSGDQRSGDNKSGGERGGGGNSSGDGRGGSSSSSTVSGAGKGNSGSSSSGMMSSGGSSGSSSASSAKSSRMETIPTTSLASASYLLDAGKVLIRWLTRFPFLGKLNYDEISRKLTKHCFELAMLSQRDSFADNAIEEVQYLCTKIIELCEGLIHSSDSLVIQPAGIDIITLRKRNEQDWGLQFESSYWGLHQITGVKLSSPAQQSGHLERGDEILQVNYQTVLAWPQVSVIGLLHENENEVILTVKRRPRHASTNLLLLGGHQNNMYLNKIPNRKSFFERRAKEEKASRECTIVVEKRPLREVEERSEELVNSLPDQITRVVEIVRDEARNDADSNKESVGNPESNNTPLNKDSNNKERGGGGGGGASDARFWKLYPKPKYLIKRRATVTGASPTDTRPPVTFINNDDGQDGTTSTNQNILQFAASMQRADPMNGLRENASTTKNQHQQVHHRRSTPVTTMSGSNEPTPIMQLLNPPLVHRPPLDKSRSAPEEDTGNVHEPPPPQVNEEVAQKQQVATRKHEDDEDDVFLHTGRSPTSTTSAPPPTPPVVHPHTTSAPPPPPPITTTSTQEQHHPIVHPPTPKPRLSRSSASDKQSIFEPVVVTPTESYSPQTPMRPVDAPPPPPPRAEPCAPLVEPPTPRAEPPTPRGEPPTPRAEPRAPLVEPSTPRAEPPAPLVEPPSPRVEPPTHRIEPPTPRAEQPAPLVEPPIPRGEPPTPRAEPTPPPTPVSELLRKERLSPPTVLYRGILHIRSQLRKQSSSNSASALPVIGSAISTSTSNTMSGSTSSIPSALMLCSSSPRWIRQNAVFYSNRELEILNPVARSASVSNSSSCTTTTPPHQQQQQQSFRVTIAADQAAAAAACLRKQEFAVMHASEVHSRPFAFKITSGDSLTYYLAAESQVELDQWISVMTTGEVRPGSTSNKMPSHHGNSSPLQRLLGTPGTGLSSIGDSGRRNFSSARAPYKRSISLGSQSPPVSYTNLSTHTPPQSGTPPPCSLTSSTSSTGGNTTTTTTPTPCPRFYGSSTNLSSSSSSARAFMHRMSSTASYGTPSRDSHNHHHHHQHEAPSRSLNRSKSSSLKTDWFLRNSSSNISSITITSKKVTKSQVTQYPTPNSTPTKTAQQPMMGVAMKTKKNSSSSCGSSANTSPTRKYMCPNCCNVVKIDMGTQTETGTAADTPDTPPKSGGELKLVFFNEESRV